jgi:exonuclease III
MHGFQQSCEFLVEMCASCQFDLIHVQEHWLNDANMHKLAADSPDYIMYGESAMNDATSRDVLVGRPYGGCATLVKCELASVTECRLMTDRIVALAIAGSLFVNLYLPCEDSEDARELTIDILASVAAVINDDYYDYVFIGGDMNTDLNCNRKHAAIVRDFLSAHDMSFCKLSNSMQYTYSNEKSVSYSTIDFWCLSSVIMQYVSLYSTIDSAICFSDHLPIRLLVALPADNSLARGLSTCRVMFRAKTKLSGQGTCALEGHSASFD